MNSFRLAGAVVLTSLLAACAHAPVPTDLSAFEAAKPRSILVPPPVNHSLDVDAPYYMLSALPVPLAEKGFYVVPVNTTKVVLEAEGLYEADRIAQQPPADLAKLFGADAILYVTINRWDAQYAVLATVVTVDFDYRIVSNTGTELWKHHQVLQYKPQSQNTGSLLGNLIAAAVTAALERAKPNYMPLTRQANALTFVTGPDALPNGPYAATAQ
jgi:hypothetical protein